MPCRELAGQFQDGLEFATTLGRVADCTTEVGL
jgi:hypothetical protein